MHCLFIVVTHLALFSVAANGNQQINCFQNTTRDSFSDNIDSAGPHTEVLDKMPGYYCKRYDHICNGDSMVCSSRQMRDHTVVTVYEAVDECSAESGEYNVVCCTTSLCNSPEVPRTIDIYDRANQLACKHDQVDVYVGLKSDSACVRAFLTCDYDDTDDGTFHIVAQLGLMLHRPRSIRKRLRASAR